MFPRLSSHILYRWSVTQESEVTRQLDSGIRYFDIRLVASRNKKTEADHQYRVLHCLQGEEIVPLLESIRSWLEKHPQEVVILDFQHLYKFQTEDHTRLANEILSIFPSHLCSWRQDLAALTLSKLCSDKTQVIVIYPALFNVQATDEETLQYFWPRSLCPTPWPDTMNSDHLVSFLDSGLRWHRKTMSPSLFVSQGVMTPSWKTVLLHPRSNVRTQCADRCLHQLQHWISTTDVRPNIVISDFVDNNLIELIIKKNLHLNDR